MNLSLGASLGIDGGMGLDLVDLANSYTDVAGRLQEAETRLELLEQTEQQNRSVVNELELRTARNKAAALWTQTALLQRIVRTAHKAAAKRLELVSTQAETLERMRKTGGTVSLGEVLEAQKERLEAETVMEILSAIREAVDE